MLLEEIVELAIRQSSSFRGLSNKYDVITNSTEVIQETMAKLNEQIELLKAALANQGTAVNAEFEQVKAKFLALKGEIEVLGTAVADLTAKVEELENTDLSAEIAAVNDSLAKIDAISESDVVVPTE